MCVRPDTITTHFHYFARKTLKISIPCVHCALLTQASYAQASTHTVQCSSFKCVNNLQAKISTAMLCRDAQKKRRTTKADKWKQRGKWCGKYRKDFSPKQQISRQQPTAGTMCTLFLSILRCGSSCSHSLLVCRTYTTCASINNKENKSNANRNNIHNNKFGSLPLL